MKSAIISAPAQLALWAAFALASCTTAGELGVASPGMAQPAVAETGLAASCRTEAAGRFDFDPQAASTLPVQTSYSGYVVYGSREDFTFRCLFDRQGSFQSVEETFP